MYFTTKSNRSFILFILLTLLSSCKTIVPEDVDDSSLIVSTSIETIPDSIKGLLVFHENFQQWKRDGYISPTNQNCETDLMKSAEIVSYLHTKVSVLYDTLKVDYSLIDFAINPDCGNKEGSSTLTSEISIGYISLQCPIWYTCGHYSKGDVITSPIPEVSYVEFTVSYGDNSNANYAAGVSLWKKGEDDTDTVKVGTYVPSNPLKGQKFTIKLNSKNVVLKFIAERNSGLPIKNESDVNMAVRIHDLYIWRSRE